MDMVEENGGKTVLSASEAAEFVEFKRSRREAEIMLTLKKLVVDASRRECDRASLKQSCEFAKRVKGSGVLVSPVNVSAAKKNLSGSGVRTVCLVGGTGETLPAVKKHEAKRALRDGAEEIRLVPCYSALGAKNFAFLKREVAKVKRAVRKKSLFLSLEDPSLTDEEVALGIRAAREGGADGVCVRGETRLLTQAIELSAGKLLADCSGVENAEQLRSLLRTGASRLVTACGERIAEELFRALG